MILLDFEYERADTLEAAVALLGDSEARLLAGGTDLLPNMRHEIAEPGRLISLAAIDPAPPREMPGGSIRVDALSRLSTLERSELLVRAVPMLAESAHRVAGDQIRHMATLGGNLCQDTRCLYFNQAHDYQFVAPCFKRGGDCCYPFPRAKKNVCWSVYMSDIAPALIALDAAIEILGPGGARSLAVEDLFTGDGMRPVGLDRAEIIRAVVIPPPPPRSGWGYHKTTLRGGLEFAIVTMAVTVRLEDDGRTCADVRIAFGAVGEGPLRPVEAEKALVGAGVDDQHLADIAAAAAKEINPLPHHGFTINYLRDNIKIHLRRALVAAVERAGRS